MTATIKIPKKLLYAPVDYGKILSERRAFGVKLTYTEYDFMQLDGDKIVLFDAFSATREYAPFDIKCPPVAFPFYCGCDTDGGERVAYAGLRFSEERAQKWVALGTVGVSRESDRRGTTIGSGVCCFSDEAGYKAYAAHIKDDVHPLAGIIVLDGQTHERVELYGKTYAAFSSGWGDGRYYCYAGLSESGPVTAIVADFGMIEYPPEANERIEVPLEDGKRAFFVYDDEKSEAQNNIDRRTFELEHATDPVSLLNAYARRGYAYHSAGDTDRALSDYLAAVKYCKRITDGGELLRAWSVYDNAAEILCERRDYESAIKLMNDAVELGDNLYSGAYVRLIDLYGATKRTDKALEVAKRMVDARPDDPVAYVKYAECCTAESDYLNAAEAYEKLASQFKLYENLFDEASCFIEAGKLESAEAALDRHPAKEYYEQYWYYKAFIEYKRRRMRAALEYVERSRTIDREYLPALYLLIDIESLLNGYNSVALHAEEYKALRPENEYGYSVCAEAHLIIGNLSECAKNYCYLYDYVVRDDRYAALGAMACARSGEKKRSKALLRTLRHKHSRYYPAAVYGANLQRHGESDTEIFKIASALSGDAEFLLAFSQFLLATGNIVLATHLLDGLDSADGAFEVAAQRIRSAERIGDKKHFFKFFDYYVSAFLGGRLAPEERHTLIGSFLTSSKNGAWADE